MVIFPGLKQGLLQFFPANHNTPLYTFSDQIHSLPLKFQKAPKKIYFGTNFKQFPHFLPSLSPYFGAKFQILLSPSIQH